MRGRPLPSAALSVGASFRYQETPAVPPLLRELLRPWRRMLAIILAAMLVEMAMSLAAPWPLKAVIDNVAGNHRPPRWIDWLLPVLGGGSKGHIAAAAGIVTVLIAVITGAAMYVVGYFTESLGRGIGNDLRVRLYDHLQKLSLGYYDTTRVGTVLSTLTTDVQTIQSFASASTVNIFTESDLVATLQEGLQSIEVVQAYGREALEARKCARSAWKP
jgi:ABC-type multidrug transport system fused ATPase/permease subunit